MTANPVNALVVRGQQEVLVTDVMGSLIVAVSVADKIYTIHCQLLVDASDVLSEYIGLQPDQNSSYPLAGVTPDVFALFATLLYGRYVPGVDPKATESAQALRIKHLCQLYTFADMYKCNQEIMEKIISAIQAGFLVMQRFPEYGLIQNIYKNTAKSSLIRNFCTQSLIYTFVNGIAGFTTGGLQTLLKAEADVFDDFLQVFRASGGQVEDPRVQSIQALIQQ